MGVLKSLRFYHQTLLYVLIYFLLGGLVSVTVVAESYES